MAKKHVIQQLISEAYNPSSQLFIIGLGNSVNVDFQFTDKLLFTPYTDAHLETLLRHHSNGLFDEKVLSNLPKFVSNAGNY